MPFDEDGGPEKSESAVYDNPPTFDPYDPPTTPEAVQPTSPSPAPSSDAPDFGGTSGADSEQPSDSDSAPQEEPEEAPLPEFDPKHREPFTGLLYLGRLQETFNLWGHSFVVRTLTTEELAEIALIVKPYEGTSMKNAVEQTAIVAAAVISVDGRPLPGSIEIDNSNELTTVKYPYVARNWLPVVREQVYNKVFELEVVSRNVLEAMGKA